MTKPVGQIEWRDESGRKHWAEFYLAADNSWGALNGSPFEIEFNKTGQKRFAQILRTVVHVAIDEDETGKPITDKWTVKRTDFPA
jgi:hypothetical protein